MCKYLCCCYNILILFLNFWGTTTLFFIVATPFYIPYSTERFQLLHILTNIYFVVMWFDNSHPNRCKVVYHCGFGLHFPNDYWYWASFHALIGHLYILFGGLSFQALCLVFNPVVLFFSRSSLYILDINPSSDMWFGNIFSHPVSCLFTLFIVSFDA